jgi:hypothetical protein
VSSVHKSVLGPQINNLTQNYRKFMEKSELWIRNTERHIFYMFLTFERCPSNEIEANKKIFINHLDALQKQFPLYFKDVGVSKFEWITNSFAANNFSGLTTCEQHQLISRDSSLKDLFDVNKLHQV